MSAATAHKVSDPRQPRRGPQLIHLPTWSQLRIATRQHGPVGHGGDFFEIIQHREGHVSVLVADVCGNGPSAAAPVSRLRWLLRQHLARGEAPAGILALLNDAIVAGNEPDPFVTVLGAYLGEVLVDAVAAHWDPVGDVRSLDAYRLILPNGSVATPVVRVLDRLAGRRTSALSEYAARLASGRTSVSA